MSERIETAIEIFGPENCNCSQAVAVAFGEDVGMEKPMAMDVARGFGGGIGRFGLTCGAVTGALMILGLKVSKDEPDEKKAKAKAYEMAGEFRTKFEARHGTMECKSLVGIDLSTEEGKKLNDEKKITRTLCPDFVRTAAEILDDMV
ncbi:MAG: C_GCAxxG_C_C family protein [Rhodospirillales bacterium]|nr:C_GCAxxG_C_C family protein [Rhodospirillales bacterium]